MSYDIWIVTEDVDGNRVDVPVVESQFGLTKFYTEALGPRGIHALEGMDARAAQVESELGLLKLVRERDLTLPPGESDHEDEELYWACLETLMKLIRLTAKHSSGFVRVHE